VILRKFTHPTIVLEKVGRSLLIDPGTFTPAAAELIQDASVVLITHEHPDHADIDLIGAALEAQPGLEVWASRAVADLLPTHRGSVRVVAPGDQGVAAGFAVRVVGGVHEAIHADVPASSNVGYVIDEDVYHPGDSYFVPDVPVRTLLVPLSGPFARVDKIVDFIRAANPARAMAIHDALLTDMGKQFLAQFIDPLTDVPLTILDETAALML